MTAPLGKSLVFHLKRRGTRTFVEPHGSLSVESVSEAGIGIDDYGQGYAVANERHRIGHLGDRSQADIRADQDFLRSEAFPQRHDNCSSISSQVTIGVIEPSDTSVASCTFGSKAAQPSERRMV